MEQHVQGDATCQEYPSSGNELGEGKGAVAEIPMVLGLCLRNIVLSLKDSPFFSGEPDRVGAKERCENSHESFAHGYFCYC